MKFGPLEILIPIYTGASLFSQERGGNKKSDRLKLEKSNYIRIIQTMSLQYHPLTVTKKVFETKEACSFYFSVPEESQAVFSYQTAQFLTFRFFIDGKEYVRSYSIASSPLLGEVLRTTVGRVEGGLVSNYMLSHIKEGDQVESQKPMGEFFQLPKTLEPQNYVLFGAGIGITPLFSILKTLLETDSSEEVRLVFSIRRREDFIYRKELEKFKNKFKNKFKVECVISTEEGRLCPEKLSQMFERSYLKEALFYLCGPKTYMNMISETLSSQGVKPECVRTEDFKVIPVWGPKPDKDSVFFTAGAFEVGEPESLKAFLDGKSIEMPLNREKSLLEQMIDQGYNPPFSCTSGSCMTCMAKLKEGKVFQLEEGILDEDNIRQLEILTCQCYPLSKKVCIDYDNL